MSKQRMVKDSFWTDSYVESLSPDGKLIFLYLLTNPQCNIAGVYELRTKRMAFETGYDTEVIENMLKKFQQDGKIIYKSNWMIMVNHLKHQNLGSKVAEGVNRIIEKAPEEVRNLFTLKDVENTEGEIYPIYTLSIPYTYGSETPVELSKVKLSIVKSEEKEKNKFGSFENVRLTQKEFEELNSRLGSRAGELIEELSLYIASQGKNYKSHYATILSWDKRKTQGQIKRKVVLLN